ncbi:MAG: MFS transporter [Francisellaceae bacterium]
MSEQVEIDPSQKFTRHHFKIWFLSAMGVFMDGFDLFIIAVAIPLIAHQCISDPAFAGHFYGGSGTELATLLGLIGAATPIGAIFGAAIFGRFTDKLGRKAILILSIVFFVIFTAASAIAWGPISLIVFRFLLGIGIGADYPTGSTYVSETMPEHLKGKMLIGSFSFQAIGAISGAILGLIILVTYPETSSWRWMLGAGVIPAVIVLFLRMSLPESPKWLAEKAAAATRPSIAQSATKENIEKTSFLSLFNKKYARRTVLTSTSWFLMDVSLYGVGFFTPLILAGFGSQNSDFIAQDIFATSSAIALDMFLIIGFIMALILVDRIGRIRLQKIGFLGMSAGLLLLAISTVYAGTIATILLFAGFILFNIMVNCGPNPTTYMLPAEVFPTKIRATGHGFASCCGKTGAAVGIFILPVLKASWGLGPTMVVICITAFSGFIITALLGIETKGKTYEEHLSPKSAHKQHQRLKFVSVA